MDYHQTEEEQVQALKRWWKENGNSLLIGIGLALAAVFGWRAYQDQQATMRYEASAIYQQLIEAGARASALTGEEREKTVATIDLLADKLGKNYSETGYAMLSGFVVAARYADDNKPDEAVAALRRIEQSELADDGLKNIARIRIARLLAEKGDPDSAMALLDTISDDAFLAEVNEVKGDIFLARGEKDEARQSFEKSKELAEQAGQSLSPLLAIKISYLTEKQGL